jgi:hypothetical protein
LFSFFTVEVKAISLQVLNQIERSVEHYEELYKRKPNPLIAYELAVSNKDIYQPIYNNPFIVKSIISTDSLLKKQNANNKKTKRYVFNLGSVIGTQSELYTNKKRINSIEIRYPNYYDYKISVKIPRGYKIDGVENININENYISNGDIIAKFESNYSIEGNKLNISIQEFYKSLNYSKSKYDDFRKVINAAADFNKLNIVFVRK